MIKKQETSLSTEVFDNDFLFIRTVIKGILGLVVKETIDLLGGYVEMIAQIVGTTPSNLQSIYRKPVLPQAKSEGILDLLRLINRAYSIFGNEDIAREWFTAKISALSGAQPIDVMDTFHGRSMVHDVLERIERGEFC